MIDMVNSSTRSVSFRLNDEDSNYTALHTYDDCVPWPHILKDFIRFLEGAGYHSVAKRVSVEDSPFLTEEWTGPVHPSTDEDDWK